MNTITTNNLDRYVDYQISKSYRQAEIERLERLKGLLLRKQFLDAPTGLTKIEYNKWLKEAKKTYLLSIPTQSLLMGDIHRYPKHSKDELNESVIDSLSPNQIIQILDTLDIHTIMKLITDDFDYREIRNNYQRQTFGDTELVGNTPDGNLIAYPNRPFNRSISLRYSYHYRDGVKSINGRNAYEILYSYLRLPISVILSSINEINTHLPCNIPFDNALCSKIDEVQKFQPTCQQISTRKRI